MLCDTFPPDPLRKYLVPESLVLLLSDAYLQDPSFADNRYPLFRFDLRNFVISQFAPVPILLFLLDFLACC